MGTSRNGAWLAGETSIPENAQFRFTAQAESEGTLYASKNGITSPGITISTEQVEGTLEVGEVMLDGIPAVKAILTWKVQPYDLDAHLLIPTSDGTYEHIWLAWWIKN